MSHFTLLVVGDDVNKELEPFHEFECTGTEKYIETINRTSYYLDLYKKYGEGESFEESLEGEGILTVTSTNDIDLADKHKYGYALKIDGIITVFRRTNPNAKWDWYVEGGRWSDLLITKEGEKVNSCRRGELDLKAMINNFKVLLGEQWDSVEKQFGVVKPGLYGIKEGMSREEYMNTASFETFAILKDGKWAEEGKMGWWACVTDKDENWSTTWKKIFDTIKDNETITIVDCHI